MSLNLDENFLKHISDKLYQQNAELLKEICKDYNWNFDEMHTRFIKDKKVLTTDDFDLNEKNIVIRNQWIYNENVYYVEEDTNNVYLNGEFQGKRYGDELFTECEET